MTSNNKKLLIGGAAGTLVVGTTLAVALPLTLNNKNKDKTLSPAEAVKKWTTLFSQTNLKLKNNISNQDLPNKGEVISLNQLNTVLINPIKDTLSKDKINLTINITDKTLTTMNLEVSISSTEDSSFTNHINVVLSPFVSKADEIVDKELNDDIVKLALIEGLINTLGVVNIKDITAQKAVDTIKDPAKLNNAVDASLSKGSLKISLEDVSVGDESISFKYLAKKDNTLPVQYLNRTMTKDFAGKDVVTINGFDESDISKRNKVQDILDNISQPINVPGASDQLPPDNPASLPSDVIKNAFNDAIKDKTIPDRVLPTYKWIKVDNTTGQVTFNASFTYGSQVATKDIRFSGFETLADDQAKKLKQDVDAFKAAINSDITLTSKVDIARLQPNQQAINDVFTSGGLVGTQIPNAVNNVSRKYTLKDVFSSEGKATVSVDFTLGVQNSNYEFVINGFETDKDKAQADIDADIAQFGGATKTVNSKPNSINTFYKGDDITIQQMNDLSVTSVPPVSHGVTRTYKVTSEAHSPTLEVAITISKTNGQSKEVTYKITNMLSQADYDTKFLDVAISEYLETTYKDPTKKPSVVVPTIASEFKVTSGSTKFTVTLGEIDGEDTLGTITYTYSATNADLNIEWKNKAGSFSGFKTEKTDAEKKTIVQVILDGLSRVIDTKKPNIAPKDYTTDMANALISPLITNTFGVDPVYTFGTLGDGEVPVTITLTFGSETASTTLTLEGLKTNAEIAKEENQQSVDEISKLFMNVSKDLNNPTGYQSVNNQPLNATAAAELGITLPTDLKGTTLSYSHPALSMDGTLNVEIVVSKGSGTTLAQSTINIVVTVTGINKAQDQEDVDSIDNAELASELESFVDKNKPADDPADNASKPNPWEIRDGVMITIDTWNIDATNGTITWTATASKGKATPKSSLSGTISGFVKKINIPTAGDITGVTADVSGKNLSGIVLPTNTSLVSYGNITAGSETVDVTIEVNQGYLFSDGSTTTTITGVAVNQNKYKVHRAKLDAMDELDRDYNDKNSKLIQLKPNAPSINIIIEELWLNALNKAYALISILPEDTTLAKIEIAKNLGLKDIQSAFDQYQLAAKNSNLVVDIAEAFETVSVSDATGPIAPVTTRQPFTEDVLTNLGTMHGTFPTIDPTVNLTYTIDYEIPKGSTGEINIYIRAGEEGKATTANIDTLIEVTTSPAFAPGVIEPFNMY